MNAVDTLRQAAEQMRRRAINATGLYWNSDNGEQVYTVDTDNPGPTTVIAHAKPADIIHTAGWGPATALAVADWIDAHARQLDSADGNRSACDSPGDIDSALKVARAYLDAGWDGAPYRDATEAVAQPAEPEYLIWSNHHGAWFAPNGAGYRSNVNDAGRYTLADTKQWLGRGCYCCEVPELPIPAEQVLRAGMVALNKAITDATTAAIKAGNVNRHYAGSEVAR